MPKWIVSAPLASGYWLFKTEPHTYSFQELLKDGWTFWNGVRNFQARNFLKQVRKGDRALIYHSGKEKSVMGIANVIREAYADVDPTHPGEWVQLDIEPVSSFQRPVSLKEIKSLPVFSDLLLVKQSRLSVCPMSAMQFEKLCEMGGVKRASS